MADSANMDWFCGVNSTEFNDFQWTLNSTIYNSCFVDLVNACIHTSFVVIVSLILLVVGCCTSYRLYNAKTLIAYPWHDFRWTVFFLLWVVLMTGLAEGIICDLSRHSGATQPHLYVTPAASFVASTFAIMYYHHMECWQLPNMSWILLLYWVFAIVGEALRVNCMINEDVDIYILRFDVALLTLLFYFAYLITELNVIRTKVFGCCFQDEGCPKDLRKKNMYYSHRYVNLLSRVSFWWLNWLFIDGYKKHLEMQDLGVLSDDHGTSYHYQLFRNAYEEEKKKALLKNETPSVWWSYFRAYGKPLAWAGILKFVADTLGFISPVALGGVISYATTLYYESGDPVTPTTYDSQYVTVSEFFANGFVLVVVMFLSGAARFALLQNHYYIVIIESIHMRTAIQSFVYEKSLHLSSWTMASGEMTMGQITNHMSTDPLAILWFMQFVHYLWSVPYQLIVILILLYVELGYAALVGSCVFIITTPIQFKIGASMSKIQKSVLGFSDDRLKKSNELLQGIKLLKLYGWEEIFCRAIEAVRSCEVKQMYKGGMYMVATTFIVSSAPVLVTVVSFGLYSVIEKAPLTPEIAFSSLALFNQMTIPLFLVPTIIGFTVNAMVSTKRLRKYFAAPEIESNDDGRAPFSQGTGDDYKGDMDDDNGKRDIEEENDTHRPGAMDHVKNSYPEVEVKDTTRLLGADYTSGFYGSLDQEPTKPELPPLPDDVAIKITDGSYSWDIDTVTPIISDVNVEIPAGKLTMIVGLVGSGKSSLLSAMLGEMTTISGSVQFNNTKSKLSYGAQKAWLQNATLRDNILFGEDYSNKRYQSVIKACALQPDIDILPAGDMTEIGEKGINLSGGQKQRVSVGRSIYYNSDIVILDDPLSALDVHVGQQLFHEGIMELLIEKKRTVLLVTHQLQYLQYADKVIVMDNGKVNLQGCLKEIAEEDPQLYAKWQETINLISESENESDKEETAEEERKRLLKQVSVISVKDDEKEDDASGKLIEKEERERGSVSWRVYLTYAKAVRIPAVILIFVLATLQMAAMVATNFWLSEWSEAGANTTGNTTEEDIFDDLVYYIGGYAGLSISSILLGLVSGACNVMFALYAAKRIHIGLLRNIVHAPMRFFDTTPVGRILNRFSVDTQVIDQRLWQTFNMLIRTTLNITSAVVVNAIVVPIFIAIIVPVMIGYYFLQKFFITTSRELQRLDSITKSPIFAHFSESLGGLSTIRAYRDERRFRKKIVDTINTNNISFIYLQTANRWLGIRLDFVGALIVLIAGIGCMVSAALGALEPSLIGLSLTYALQMSGYLNWFVRNTADCEMHMNAIERTDHYTHIPTEKYQGVYTPPADWPDQGSIEVKDISVRYATELDPVLRNVTVHFRPGEKIGICGRTGSGKSSLTLSLFRMIDTFQGYIKVDDIDISHVNLLTLRNRIAIIPQDPVLFTGSIRYNLDPLGTKSDDELWEAIEIAQLKTVVSELNDKLDAKVSEGGENFSVGQRQLFCLARAFLRKARVLIMDEATASIDMETDAVLQNVVATAFAERTVLTIAHRVSTILNSDTILVLSDGKVIEYDTPDNLLSQPDSVFASLVKGSQ
ncbi:ATP-binding cassette sub-family C member 9-like [Glandiceps talaboti]